LVLALGLTERRRSLRSASEYIYHHPDDEGFLPSPLPEPNLTNIAGPEEVWPESSVTH
jgi:hypothetical protein